MIAGPRKVYDFKSVGFQQNDLANRDQRALFRSRNPIGIVTPVQFGNESDGLFAMHRNLLDQIKDNMKILIRTNHGERPPFYDFGANLLPIAFDISTDQGDIEAMRRISIAVSKYLPLVTPTAFEPITIYEDNKNVAKVGVRMKYDIPTLGVTNQGVDVVIYADG